MIAHNSEGQAMNRTILIYRCASVPWVNVDLTRPGERVHEAIARLAERHGADLVAVRPLLELPGTRADD